MHNSSTCPAWTGGGWEGGEAGRGLRGQRENQATNPPRCPVLVVENDKDDDTGYALMDLTVQQEIQTENSEVLVYLFIQALTFF